MKKILGIFASALLVLALSACGGKTAGALDENRLVVGVTSGLHEQIMEKVKEVEQSQSVP